MRGGLSYARCAPQSTPASDSKDAMTDRYLRAMLRRATQAGILNGWQGPHTDGRSYCIAPVNGDAREQPLGYVIEYVQALPGVGTGVTPALGTALRISVGSSDSS